MLGQPYDVLLRDEPYADETKERTEQAIRTGRRAGTYRSAVSHRDGRRVVLEIVERPLLDDRDTVVGVQGFARDITEYQVDHITGRKGKEAYTMRVKKIEKKSLPDSLFLPPEGFRKMTMPAGMGGFMGR